MGVADGRGTSVEAGVGVSGGAVWVPGVPQPNSAAVTTRRAAACGHFRWWIGGLTDWILAASAQAAAYADGSI